MTSLGGSRKALKSVCECAATSIGLLQAKMELISNIFFKRIDIRLRIDTFNMLSSVSSPLDVEILSSVNIFSENNSVSYNFASFCLDSQVSSI